MGKLSDDARWLQENLNELLQDGPHSDRKREEKRLEDLLAIFSGLQPNLNKVSDKSAVFSKAYDYRDALEKHTNWLEETQRLVSDDPGIDGLEDAVAYLQEHEVIVDQVWIQISVGFLVSRMAVDKNLKNQAFL